MDFRQMLQSLSQLSEATKETGKGRIHTAEPGGYGRKDDEDDEGKKVKSDAPKKGRGRPKKDAGEDGEKKTYDTKSLHGVFGGGEKPKKDIGKTSKKHSLKEYIEVVEQSISEGETIEKKGGRIHKGSYGTSYDGDDKKEKKPEVKRGRGRPKKDAGEDGEVKKYDTKSLGSVMGGKKPKTLPGKASVKHKLKEGPLDQQQQLSITPAKQNTQVIKKGNDVIGSVENPQLANQIKTAIGKGEMQLDVNDMQEGAPEVIRKKGAMPPIAEKAKSIKQQRFMGMVHATQKGEKAPSKEVAKVAKTMKKSDAKDFAKTKHKGLPMKVSESILLDAAGETLEHIANRFKHEVKNFQETGDMDTDLYEALFDYYFNAGEMPYGTAKARTGDPYEWVSRRFEQDYGLEEGIRTPAVPMGKTTTLPFGAKPSVVQKPAVMRKAAGKDFPLSTSQVSDRSNDLTNPATTTGLMKDLSKKSPFAFEGKEMKDMQVEGWEKQLNSLLTEGITITSSTGQQGAPDSVSINATDTDAEGLLSVLRNAGIGVFGGDEKPELTYGVASQGEEEATGTGTEPQMAPTVVGDGDDMLSLIKKMTGIESQPMAGAEEESGEDYQDEEDSEESGEESGEESDEESEEQTDEGVLGTLGGAALGGAVGGPVGAAAGAVGGQEATKGGSALFDEEETTEGNAFGAAVAKAKADGIQKGEKVNVGGKTYPVKEEDMEEGNKFTGNLAKARAAGKKEADLDGDGDMEKVHEGEHTCEACGMNESDCGCDHEQVDENFANSANDPATAELMKLKALLSMGNDLNKPKHSQTVGNPTQVAFRESIDQWKKLSGIK